MFGLSPYGPAHYLSYSPGECALRNGKGAGFLLSGWLLESPRAGDIHRFCRPGYGNLFRGSGNPCGDVITHKSARATPSLEGNTTSKLLVNA